MSNLNNNTTQLELLLQKVNELPEAGSAEPILQDKTVTPTTSKQTITADSGYDGLDTVTVNAMPTAAQATPSITINTSTGLITATATQSAGYVLAGTKSDTEQLTVQAAQTITPGTTDKTIAAGRYLTGTQTIKGDANLVASNIVSGKSIFGVSGTAKVGNDTSDATAAAEDIMLGETAYIASGKVIGTFTLEDELEDQDTLLAEIAELVATKASPPGGDSIETCTITFISGELSEAFDIEICYLDSNLQFKKVAATVSRTSGLTIETVKNSIIVFTKGYAGGIENLILQRGQFSWTAAYVTSDKLFDVWGE